jgi:hypothetical protein
VFLTILVCAAVRPAVSVFGPRTLPVHGFIYAGSKTLSRSSVAIVPHLGQEN